VRPRFDIVVGGSSPGANRTQTAGHPRNVRSMLNIWRMCLRQAAATLLGISFMLSLPLRSEQATAAPPSYSVPKTYLEYDGLGNYVEVAHSPVFSQSKRGLTVAVWVRPDALVFPKHEGGQANEQYVHWLGKGQAGNQEWTFRMYSLKPPGPRKNRISFYVFSPAGNRGCGSYFQDPIRTGQWIQVVGIVDAVNKTTAIYKNGEFRHRDSYKSETPTPGHAPLRFGTRDFASFFKGAIGPVLIWNRPLASSEVKALFTASVVPQNGLVAAFANDEGSGTVVNDRVGGTVGKVHGATWRNGKGPVSTATGSSGGGC
jgi:Concanavalin A-like lectin/glucanases superfamily